MSVHLLDFEKMKDDFEVLENALSVIWGMGTFFVKDRWAEEEMTLTVCAT